MRLAALQGAPVVAAAVVVAVIASGAVGFGPGSQRGGSNCGTATEVPGTAALNQGGDAAILSVSCRSAGNCSAGGIYKDSSGRSQAFVVNQKNGTWSTAEEVPGFAPGRGCRTLLGVMRVAGQLQRGRGVQGQPRRHQAYVDSES